MRKQTTREIADLWAAVFRHKSDKNGAETILPSYIGGHATLQRRISEWESRTGGWPSDFEFVRLVRVPSINTMEI